MPETTFVTILLSLVAAMFGLLVAVVGWIGNKLYERLGQMAGSMTNIERDLHGRITELDKRVVKVETHLFVRRDGD